MRICGRHLQESAHKAESLSDTVGSITHGVSAWKEAIERDRKEQEEWRRSCTTSPRTPRSSAPILKKYTLYCLDTVNVLGH